MNTSLKSNLMERKAFLEELLQRKTKELQQNKDKKLHGKRIRAVSHGKSFQYYLREDEKDINGVYIKKKDIDTARKIIQREYDEKIIDNLKKELKAVEYLLYKNRENAVESLYEKFSPAKRNLIDPILKTDDEFVTEWMTMGFKTLGFDKDAREYYSNGGLRVRSKSEGAIADCLDKLGVSYKYEKALKLDGYKIVYPDFTLLDVKNRREIYYEHLGMMDSEGYVNDNILKLKAYQKNGIYLGERLLISMETQMHPVDIRFVEMTIRNALGI